MEKNKKLYSELAKKLMEYSDEPSKYKRRKMLCSLDGKLGAMRRNNRKKEAMALEELRKVMRKIK